jgi:hypothetical protein
LPSRRCSTTSRTTRPRSPCTGSGALLRTAWANAAADEDLGCQRWRGLGRAYNDLAATRPAISAASSRGTRTRGR